MEQNEIQQDIKQRVEVVEIEVEGGNREAIIESDRARGFNAVGTLIQEGASNRLWRGNGH